MSVYDPYTDPHQGHTGFDPKHLNSDPLRPSYRSGLITVNEVTCGSGLGTPRCAQEGIAVRSLVATGVVGITSMIAIKVAGSFVVRLRAGAALIALTIGVGAMTVLVVWLRQDLGLPFPW